MSSIDFLIGIDGGGTRTRARLCDGGGRVLGEGVAGPSALGQGAEQAWRHVREAVQRAAEVAGCSAFDWGRSAIGLGLSGAGLPDAAQAFRDSAPPVLKLALETDVWAGLLGAHGGSPGGLLIGGTGSVLMALWPDGHRSRVGGWGWRLGDEGSGAWLGQQALRHLHRALDGREPRGSWSDAVLARVGGSAGAMLSWQRDAGQHAFAELAPLVFDHEASDPIAATVIAAAVEELRELLQAIDPSHQLPWAVGGSVAQRLLPRLKAVWPAQWTEPQGDAMAGALRLLQA
jgi:glucosamine kinase